MTKSKKNPLKRPLTIELTLRKAPVRISAAKMDSLMMLAEEMRAVNLSEIQGTEEIREFKEILDNYRKEWAKVSLSVKALKKSLKGEV